MSTSSLTAALVADLMVTFIETPFCDWMTHYNYEFNGPVEAERRAAGAANYGNPTYADPAFWRDGATTFSGGNAMILTDDEGDIYPVTLPKLQEAFETLDADMRQRILTEGAWDAIDADALVQMACFSEVIYG